MDIGFGDAVWPQAEELRATGQVSDPQAYRSLRNVRAAVNERYGEAIRWLRQQGREGEARRFELMYRNLPPVRSEKQLIAESLLAGRTQGAQRADDPAQFQ